MITISYFDQIEGDKRAHAFDGSKLLSRLTTITYSFFSFVFCPKMWKSSLLLLLIIVVIIDAASVRKQPDKVINKSPAKSVENSDEDIDWECGTEGFSKIWSYQMINESCPHLLSM